MVPTTSVDPPALTLAPPVRPARSGLEGLLACRFRPLVAGHRAHGLVVAAISPAGAALACHGGPGADPDTLGPASIFEIGSITKPVTGVLLAAMVAAGEVALDDPVRRFLPQPAARRLPGGREITLRDLATHTSGLPRLPRNLLLRALRRWPDPCAGYTADDLERALAGAGGGPTRYRYSNFGFAVLGHVLGLAAGTGYERLVVERVCRPLGMASTGVRVPPERRHLRAPGHRWGRPVPDWDLGALAGAGGLRSTGADMLRFLRANLAPGRTPLCAALEAAQADLRATGRGGVTIGLGWPHRVERGRRLTWHHGATGGFRSVIAFDRAASCGVVALANWGPLLGMPLDTAAFAVLRDLAEGTVR